MQGNMNPQDVEKLRIASNQFYMNKYLDQPTISDKEFDRLRQEYEHETGHRIYELVEWEGQKRKNELPIGLVKSIVESNDLSDHVTKYLTKQCEGRGYNLNEPDPEGFNICDYVNYYLNYKYDGCSIIGIYKDHRLQEVRSTPDEFEGIVRTKAFINIFPDYIDDGDVIALQGEALVDYRAYGQLARNKANGLVNSIYKDDEVGREIFVRIYKVYYKSEVEDELKDDHSRRFYRQIRTLDQLPKIVKNRERLGEDGQLHSFDDIVFSSAERFIASQCPKDALVTPHGWDTSAYFQVDGVVLYNELETRAFKFYYTESAITTVRNVEWNLQANGGWAPKLQFDEIVLNDKHISQAASGGVPNLMAMRMGIGAKVKVILANMTIPKIIEVIEHSEEYNWPKCSCGYQIGHKDIFGSGVKCQSTHCDRRAELWFNALQSTYENSKFEGNKESYILENPHLVLTIALQIDRWDSRKKLRSEYKDSIGEDLVTCIKNNNLDAFYDFIVTRFVMSDLQLANFTANYGPAFSALVKFFNA